MKKKYPNSKIADIFEMLGIILWVGMIFASIWVPEYEIKIFLTSWVWLGFMFLVFYKPEKKGKDNKF